MNKGWISIHREIQDHWLWNDKRVFSKLEAWLDILLSVNYSDKKVVIKNDVFIVKRGQSINSQITWSERWNWNRSKVRRFLELLENDNMIELKTNNITTILTVCKYSDYQDLRTSDEHQTNIKRTSDEHQTNTNNNNNNINKENKDSAIEFLKSEIPSQFETYEMQNAKNVTDINSLYESFNNTVVIDVNNGKLNYDPQSIIARLRKYTDSWVRNQKPKKQDQSHRKNIVF